MSPADRVLVTGGSGFVGGAVVELLIAEGREVRALARSPDASAAVERLGAIPVPGDVLDPDTLALAMRGCAAVFHVAGVSAICRRDHRPMLRTNVEGSANVVRAAARQGVPRLVHTSSGAAIGEPAGTVGREDTLHRGWYLSSYERSKHQGERRALELGQELGVEVVSVNPSSVHGPGRTKGSARLLLRLANDRLPVAIETTMSVVDLADCAQGHLLAEASGVPGRRYLLSGAALSTREAIELLGRVSGRRPSVRFVPGRLALGAAGVAEGIARLLRIEPPICRDAVRTLVHGHRYDGSRAARELGLRYTPIEETLRRTLAWYAERGVAPPPPGEGSAPSRRPH